VGFGGFGGFGGFRVYKKFLSLKTLPKNTSGIELSDTSEFIRIFFSAQSNRTGSPRGFKHIITGRTRN
jgi:hypothetical protein